VLSGAMVEQHFAGSDPDRGHEMYHDQPAALRVV
jgi:hypothetical protein